MGRGGVISPRHLLRSIDFLSVLAYSALMIKKLNVSTAFFEEIDE